MPASVSALIGDRIGVLVFRYLVVGVLVVVVLVVCRGVLCLCLLEWE